MAKSVTLIADISDKIQLRFKLRMTRLINSYLQSSPRTTVIIRYISIARCRREATQ